MAQFFEHWNHDDVSPNRSRDELLGDVVHRGERLRRRRRIGLSLGSGLAVLLAVAGVASVVARGGEPSTQLAAGSRSTTTLAVTGPTTGGTVFAVDQPSTSVAPPAVTEDTLPQTSTTAYQPGSAATGAATTTTTEPPPAAAAGHPTCGPAQLTATVALAPSYPAGAPISGPVVLRNTSGAVCWYVSYTSSRSIVDAGGNPVIFGGVLIADAFADTPLAPGETLNATIDWDQKVCVADPSCPQAPVGSYTGSVTWDFGATPVVATATFAIV